MTDAQHFLFFVILLNHDLLEVEIKISAVEQREGKNVVVSLRNERKFPDNLTCLCSSTKTSTFGRSSGEDDVKGCPIYMKLHSCTTEIRMSKIVLQISTMAFARV